MRLRSDTLCWLRRASRDGSCRLVIQNGAGAPEAAAGQGNTTPFFPPSFRGYHTEHFATCHAKPARRFADELPSRDGQQPRFRLVGNGVAWSRLKRCALALQRRSIPGEGMCQFTLRCFLSDTSKNCGRRCATTGWWNRIRVAGFYERRRHESRSGTKADRGEGPPALLESLKAD